ncbi:2-phospho-L-lactate guanylyltransferase [Microbacteriaceae bacterium SG_E_30_P1]|uniref:2-phospho-L-lactate guanylyltransferase n=1 Tax=Antiquaquibacter oligotrophicus TaxID=2880260 RepID=A0ABT6KN82_9MICO|nr:2-phospho-L-lactate guanylyltransferase [Antiquaquibacter oligotrophicus]MDH6181469.1 2-phospho-L-lactate guanylyltransferase [Antiquaquibacter oligotrophicus]UDF12841.1 2-phospho-L-lactate guanylyltransferase [Antiquaquibacter oligotrophicus]
MIIPVKGARQASKSRFGPGDHRDLALAMALDTVAAALVVAPVVVVTVGGAEFQSLGARVVQDAGLGLNAAIQSGLAVVDGSTTGTVALLADHPALQPTELREALAAAEEFERSMVADSDGSGTALVAARAGVGHDLAFGANSRAAHRARGYVELDGGWPGLRRDIDVPDHFGGLNLGPRTLEFVQR